MKSQLENKGHKIIETKTVQFEGKTRVLYLTQKNDIYSDGEVERWCVYTNLGHVRNACRLSLVRRWFNEYARQFEARGRVNL